MQSFPALIERIDKATGGRIQIELYAANALVGASEMADALAAGMIEVAYTGLNYYAGQIPIANIGPNALPPSLWRSPEEQSELYLYRGLEDLLREGLAEYGIYYWTELLSGDTGWWSKYPMYGVGDLAGFKVRFYGYILKVLEVLGAAPVYLPHPEVYTALATGVIDGSGT